MRAVLQAISDELIRLKYEGEQTVPVSEKTLIGLRALVRRRAGKAKTPGVEPGTESAAVGARSAAPGVTEAPTPRQPRAASLPIVLPALPATTPPSAKPLAPSLPPPPVVELPQGDKATRWAALQAIITTHPVCAAQVSPGKKLVLGVGPLDAKIFFVGDAPGEEEELAGEPFVGPAGQLLDRMIRGMGLERGQVYIGSLLCWRPLPLAAEGAEQLGHRSPTPEEMAFCLPFLQAAIDIVKPDLIVALGGSAAQGLLGGNFTTLAAARSKWHEVAGTPLMVTYHPSYLLRSASNRSKRAVWEDLLLVMEKARLPISEKQRQYFL